MLKILNKLEPFFENNYRRINVREYAKIQKISPPNASIILNNLRKENILLKEEDRKYHFFYANKEDPLFVKLQQIYYQLKFKKITEYLEEEFIAPVIILFGSFAKAEVNENSDIDLAVFSVTKKKVDLKNFEKKFSREIQLFVFKNRRELRQNKELLNNILNGIKISGGW